MELRPVVRGRAHPEDLDPVVPVAPRRSVEEVQGAGHHGDVELVGEVGEELREQVRGRLEAGPVVLVEDEHARPSHRASRPGTAATARSPSDSQNVSAATLPAE